MHNGQCSMHNPCGHGAHVHCAFGIVHSSSCLHFLFHCGEFAGNTAINNHISNTNDHTAQNCGVEPVLECELVPVLAPQLGFQLGAVVRSQLNGGGHARGIPRRAGCNHLV